MTSENNSLSTKAKPQDKGAWLGLRPETLVTLVLIAVLLVPLSGCLLYTSPSPRDATLSRMPSSA